MDIGYGDLTVRPGAHMVLLYETVEKALSITAKILAKGLKQGDKCLFCGSQADARELADRLAEEGVDPKKAEKKHNLKILHDRENLLVNGRFDPDKLTAQLHGFIKESLELEKRPARIAVDVSWLTRGAPGGERMLDFEAKVDELFSAPDVPVLGLCMHSISEVNSDELVRLLEIHPLAIIGENLRVNPYYYQPPEE